MNSSISSNSDVIFALRYSFSIECVLRRANRDHRVFKVFEEVLGNVTKIPCAFQLVSQTKEEEDAFDFVQKREGVKTNNLLGSVAHLVKGTLGAGLLGTHVAYMKAGVAVAIPLTFFVGLYIGYCMSLLVYSAQILYKRTTVPSMTYADVGEAAVCCFPNPKVSRYSKVLRYYIDAVLALTLFGNCACYQLVVSKSLKQLVEHSLKPHDEEEAKEFLALRIYLLGMTIPIIFISLIRHLKYLAPFSIVANVVVLFCMGMAIHYATTLNPNFEHLEMAGKFSDFFEFNAMIMFAMSCSIMVLPVENSMSDPRRFPLALFLGMGIIMLCTFTMAFFGYSAFLEKSDAPITVNFPMNFVPKVIKGMVAFMLLVNHALSFWILFSLCWVYLKEYHSPQRLVVWEFVYRVLFVIMMAVLAITFPDIKSLMGMIGALCISNLAFILPNIIYLLVIWQRPGFGKYNWRLWKIIILMAIGVFCCVGGTYVNGWLLLKSVKKPES